MKREEGVVQVVRACCLTITLGLIVTACAGRPPPKQPLPTTADLAAQGIECHKERATGSNVAATVCTTAADRARAADSARETKDLMESTKAGGCPPNVICN